MSNVLDRKIHQTEISFPSSKKKHFFEKMISARVISDTTINIKINYSQFALHAGKTCSLEDCLSSVWSKQLKNVWSAIVLFAH